MAVILDLVQQLLIQRMMIRQDNTTFVLSPYYTADIFLRDTTGCGLALLQCTLQSREIINNNQEENTDIFVFIYIFNNYLSICIYILYIFTACDV